MAGLPHALDSSPSEKTNASFCSQISCLRKSGSYLLALFPHHPLTWWPLAQASGTDVSS